MILEVNGKPYDNSFISTIDESNQYRLINYVGNTDQVVPVFMGGSRRDVATIIPNDELKVYMKFNDFFGKHVMPCHNVVHEEHAMMIRWDIVPKDKAYVNGKRVLTASNAYDFC